MLREKYENFLEHKGSNKKTSLCSAGCVIQRIIKRIKPSEKEEKGERDSTHGNSLTIRILYDKMKCMAVRVAESAKLRFPGSNPGDASRKAPVGNVGGLIIREQRIKNK